ncbi:MAG: signaling domain protein osmotic stress response related protein [Myxococcales bacterium]|nr:signaling domain protein osmotic stress response related protein [Myxococcales bacterium]
MSNREYGERSRNDGWMERGRDQQRFGRDDQQRWGRDQQPEMQRSFDQQRGGREDEGGYNYGYGMRGYDREGYGREGNMPQSFGREGSMQQSYGREGFGREGNMPQSYYGREGFGREGYGREGFGREGYGREGFMPQSFGREGYTQHGYAQQGYSQSQRQMGRPPKGFVRSDERLKEEISEIIMRTGWIDAGDVVIEVRDGEVTLTGTVDDRQQKRALEDLSVEVLGVKDVHNQVRVQPTSMEGRGGQSERTQQHERQSGGSARKPTA